MQRLLEAAESLERPGRWQEERIYHPLAGAEQLFDLRVDPGEERDLAGDRERAAELRLWRGRLAAHFGERGETVLKGGWLNPRPEGYLYSPHCPDSGPQG